jgi:hypothetical protein
VENARERSIDKSIPYNKDEFGELLEYYIAGSTNYDHLVLRMGEWERSM